MLPRSLKYILSLVALALLLALFLPALFPTRQVPRYSIIETLTQPVPVADWDEEGLLLADGRHVQLPGILKLPATSEALSLATESGVEIDEAGNVTGLVRVHRWCGNDPCRKHIARVNLSHVLMYFHEGKVANKLPAELTDEEWNYWELSDSERGWRVGDFLQFQSWSRLDKERGI